MTNSLLFLSYLLSAVLFIISIRSLASPETARKGNLLGIFGMILAIFATLFSSFVSDTLGVGIALIVGALIGSYFALKVKMTALPQMIAAFNGLGGLSAVLIALAEILSGSALYVENALGLLIGAIAFSGSILAFAKLQGLISAKPLRFPLQREINLLLALLMIASCADFVISGRLEAFYLLAIISLLLGITLILPIGGADMPIVISILNSFSGWAAVGIGFSLNNILLIIVGAIVGASGAILSSIMTKAMNRSLITVLFGSFNSAAVASDTSSRQAKAGNPQDAAFIMENASKVIIVPGYGMAVAQAQHILKEMAEVLALKYGVEVKFAIHPVAGRMPGHMNVLLAEANVPYEDVFELEAINREFATADVAYVIGANDVTNPLAKTDTSSPIYGMPILDVGKAKTVFFVKRSLATGYSGVDNPLFYAPNTFMLYGDAKKVTEEITSVLER